jgi:hypothetical protein
VTIALPQNSLPLSVRITLGEAATERQAIEHPGEHGSRDGPLDLNRHCLVRGIVDDGQALDHAPFRRVVKDEVHGPDLVGCHPPQ